MDKQELYDQMAARKSQPKDFGDYIGDNGRVNRCVQLMKQGKIKAGGQILDIGGGIGDLICAVTKQERLFDFGAVLDISESNLQAAMSKGCAVAQSDMDKDGIPDLVGLNYDIVTALDFIEHIVDPEHFARECFRVLKSGGQVFVNTPNIEFWKHIELLLVHGKFPHTSGDREVYHGGHLAFFTFSDLCEIFGAAGFAGFKQIDDPENYQAVPKEFLDFRRSKNQHEYVRNCSLMGNSNLLFLCEKP